MPEHRRSSTGATEPDNCPRSAAAAEPAARPVPAAQSHLPFPTPPWLLAGAAGGSAALLAGGDLAGGAARPAAAGLAAAPPAAGRCSAPAEPSPRRTTWPGRSSAPSPRPWPACPAATIRDAVILLLAPAGADRRRRRPAPQRPPTRPPSSPTRLLATLPVERGTAAPAGRAVPRGPLLQPPDPGRTAVAQARADLRPAALGARPAAGAGARRPAPAVAAGRSGPIRRLAALAGRAGAWSAGWPCCWSPPPPASGCRRRCASGSRWRRRCWLQLVREPACRAGAGRQTPLEHRADPAMRLPQPAAAAGAAAGGGQHRRLRSSTADVRPVLARLATDRLRHKYGINPGRAARPRPGRC